jgi:hypothetical protein
MNMRRVISGLLIASTMSMSIPVWADGTAPVPSVVAPAPTISPMTKGQPAPFPGVLLSADALATIVASQDTAAASLSLAVKHQQDLDAAQSTFQLAQQSTTCAADKSVLQAQVTADKKDITDLTNQLKQNSGGLSTPVWIGIGVVGGVVLSLLTVYAVNQAQK